MSYKALYGPNKPSPKKIKAVKLFMKGQDFETIGKVLGVVTATAQVYTIDGHCSGAPLSFPELCDSMNLTPTDIKTLSDGIKRHGTSLNEHGKYRS
jgi:hypothetical protein